MYFFLRAAAPFESQKNLALADRPYAASNRLLALQTTPCAALNTPISPYVLIMKALDLQSL